MPQTNDEQLERADKCRNARESRKRIDLDFRPETYFWPLNLQAHLLSHIKGAKRREMLQAAIANSEIDSVLGLINDAGPDGSHEPRREF